MTDTDLRGGVAAADPERAGPDRAADRPPPRA